ncbi:ATP-binding protein [Streptacidiphilus pinicola]|uniref:ATP-binding protein n=1 Tax=Streptacidiphilus pinicola TaxID=2219663 RepID=UPI001FB3CB73|nr:ATP-binding protein [Streptacidiphilus pinicola]
MSGSHTCTVLPASATAGDRPSASTAAHEWTLPHHPEAAGIARRLTLAALRAWNVGEEAANQVVLAVSELVTNAVEHALPPVALHLAQPCGHRLLRIEVTDGGPARQPGAWTSSCEPDEHGRGSMIVDFMAAAHGTRLTGSRTTHWADLPVAA